MNRTWKLLCLSTIVAATLTASPLRAADPEKDKSDRILDALNRIAEDMQRMKEENATLRRDLSRLQDDTDRRQRLNDNRDTTFEQRLRILENKLEALERKTAPGRISGSYNPEQPAITAEKERELQSRVDRLERMQQSGSFTPEVVRPLPLIPALGTGTVRVQNSSIFTCTVTINGAAQLVMPGQTVLVNVPAGLFTYDVVSSGLGFLRSNTLALPANGERVLNIF